LGQWLNARIYERRCDLSPDGKYLIYFALNGKWDSETRGSYTAISRAPYLKAIGLFAKGDAWNGGGLFTGPNTYWLNGADCHTTLRATRALLRVGSVRQPEYSNNECLGVYYPRLLRDGWRFVERKGVGDCNSLDVFEKPAVHGWTLRKLAHAQIGAPAGKGCYWDEHQLLKAATGTELSYPDWEWAEMDGKRLVWAEYGKLYAGDLQPEGLTSQTVLQDFTGMKFEPIEAPY
jgi:hypothetical protein